MVENGSTSLPHYQNDQLDDQNKNTTRKILYTPLPLPLPRPRLRCTVSNKSVSIREDHTVQRPSMEDRIGHDAAASAAPAAASPRDAKKEEVISFVSKMLNDRQKRCTYISVKRRCLEVFTERSFAKAKRNIQSMLEDYHKRLTPARPKGRGIVSPRGSVGGGDSGKRPSASAGAEGADGAEDGQVAKKQAKRNPKLFFYQMSNEEDSGAEGNRFISNSDL